MSIDVAVVCTEFGQKINISGVQERPDIEAIALWTRKLRRIQKEDL